jgi:MFS family permease
MFSRTNPVAQAVVGDLNFTDPKTGMSRKMLYMGWLQSAISLGAFIGPVLGGNLAGTVAFTHLNFSLPFFVAAAFALVAFFVTLFSFQETLQTPQPFSLFKLTRWPSMKLFFLNRHIVAISAVLLLIQISWSLYYQFIPPTLKISLHADGHQIGYFVGWVAFWLAMATLVGLRILDQFLDAAAILRVSLGLVFIGTLLTVLFFVWPVPPAGQWLLWLLAVPVAAGDVIAFSCLCTLYSDAVEHSEQGRIMGVCFIVIAAVWMVTALMGGQLFAIHTLLPLAVTPCGAFLAYWVARRFLSS